MRFVLDNDKLIQERRILFKNKDVRFYEAEFEPVLMYSENGWDEERYFRESEKIHINIYINGSKVSDFDFRPMYVEVGGRKIFQRLKLNYPVPEADEAEFFIQVILKEPLERETDRLEINIHITPYGPIGRKGQEAFKEIKKALNQ